MDESIRNHLTEQYSADELAEALLYHPGTGTMGNLSLPQFFLALKLETSLCLELACVNKQGEILLSWRDDADWRGWHFPGGFRRDEDTMVESMRNIAFRELRIRPSTWEMLTDSVCSIERRHFQGRVFENRIDSLIFCIEYNGPIPEGFRWFAEMPDDLLEHQVRTWKIVQDHLQKSKT